MVEEQAVEPESAEEARAAVSAHLARLAAHGVTASGQVLTSVGDHAAAGRVLAEHAARAARGLISRGCRGRSPGGTAGRAAPAP